MRETVIGARCSHVIERLRQLVEGRVAVDLVFHRIEEGRLVARVVAVIRSERMTQMLAPSWRRV
jgi:hypothetical protein